MDPCRIACVKYINTVPLVHGLDKLAGVVLIPTVPSRIAGLVRSGEADVGLVSVVDTVREEPRLALLPVGMIGCDGPTLTVRLFSRVPPERITTVAADTDSHTSVILCRVLLEKVYQVRPAFVDFDARERVVVGAGAGAESEESAAAAGRPAAETGSDLDAAWPETVLLIGDKVVTDAPPRDRYPHQLDLGEAWKQLTGLPFVYAMWACREVRAGDPAVRAAAAVLDRQRRHNATRLDWIAAVAAPEHRWPEDIARSYFRDRLRFEVTPAARRGAETFLSMAGLGAPAWADLRPAAVL